MVVQLLAHIISRPSIVYRRFPSRSGAAARFLNGYLVVWCNLAVALVCFIVSEVSEEAVIRGQLLLANVVCCDVRAGEC